MLSKYFKSLQVDTDVHAIFNTMLMDVIFVNDKELDEIKDNSIANSNARTMLLEKGIFVTSDNQDKNALKRRVESYKNSYKLISVVYFIVSSECNLGCKYCFVANKNEINNEKKIMSFLTAKNFIDQYFKYIQENNIKKCTFIFYGGEPTINWEVIEQIISYANKINLPVNYAMVTNGTLLSSDKRELIKKHEIELGISIDGPQKINDKNRVFQECNKSVYEIVYNTIEKFKIEQIPYGLSITISDEVLNNRNNMFKWLKDINSSSIFYNLLHFTEKSDYWKSYSDKANNYLIQSYEKLQNYGINDGRIQRKIDSFINKDFKYSDCAAIGGNQITVKHNGDICVCHGYANTDKYVMGNINKNNLFDILKCKEYEFWTNRSPIFNQECLDCEAIYLCGGGCALESESLFDDRAEIDEPFCMHTKSILKWLLQRGYQESFESEVN